MWCHGAADACCALTPQEIDCSSGCTLQIRSSYRNDALILGILVQAASRSNAQPCFSSFSLHKFAGLHDTCLSSAWPTGAWQQSLACSGQCY